MRATKTLALAACAATALACTAGAATAAARETGCSEAGGTGAFGFAVAALVTDDRSEPGDIHLKTDAYGVDEPLRIFLVPAGYGCRREKDGYGANFDMGIQLIYRGDVVADQPDVKTFDFHAAEKIKSIKINMDDKISGLVPGAFALRVTLVDTIGDRRAEVILPFTIAP